MSPFDDDPRRDALGRVHAPAGPEARIVSLVPSLTELLFALGLGPRVVGRTTFCVHPAEEVSAVPAVGGTKKFSFEKLTAVRPTHVLVNVDENRREDVERLEERGLEVVVTHPLGPRDNPALYRLIGSLFDVREAAERLVDRLEEALRRVETEGAALPPRRVLYLIWRKPWMTVSRDTYIARMLALVNWHTLPAESAVRYPEIPDDDPAWREADRVLLSSEPYPFAEKHEVEVRERLGERGVPVRFVDAERVSWYGSRAVEGVPYLLDLARSDAGRAS
jgi:ABC-type Fe3+-hydroxamate transport system substrate-binding protein